MCKNKRNDYPLLAFHLSSFLSLHPSTSISPFIAPFPCFHPPSSSLSCLSLCLHFPLSTFCSLIPILKLPLRFLMFSFFLYLQHQLPLTQILKIILFLLLPLSLSLPFSFSPINLSISSGVMPSGVSLSFWKVDK